ncbi:hypothetical protein HOD20_02715 [archaeon]|jgi:hypothetical protein|nr:hypothetical protein [archaeon]MBT4351418.1 hypothetical protein [archaeon]MBT4647291.1 hypothetical protein [archaeon]MBT6821146.1 hypothetical protein [archaeon]MBT7391686.1 hypothetical protein [archaeon]
MNKKMNLILMLMIIISIIPNVFGVEINDFLSISLINQDPDPAIAGDTLEIRIGLENKGENIIENRVIEMDYEYPFEPLTGEDNIEVIESISPNIVGTNALVLKFKVRINREAVAGNYNIHLLEYEEGKKDKAVKRLYSIDIKNKESAEVIYIDTVSLIPGHEQQVKFTINNVGSAPLKDITFSWENEDDIILPVGSDNTKYIKYIDVGEKEELSYNVIADSESVAGLYKLDLSLTYDDPLTSEEKEISTIAGIYVGGGTDFDVAFSEFSNNEYSFSIANVGSNPANSVTITIPQQQGWKVSGSNSEIIGNLNKGDYTVASFSVTSSGATKSESGTKDFESMSEKERQEMREKVQSGEMQRPNSQNNEETNTIKIDVHYTDTKGERKTSNMEVYVNPNSASAMGTRTGDNSQFQKTNPMTKAISTIKTVGIGIVIIIAGLFIYKKSKKGKKK